MHPTRSIAPACHGQKKEKRPFSRIAFSRIGTHVPIPSLAWPARCHRGCSAAGSSSSLSTIARRASLQPRGRQFTVNTPSLSDPAGVPPPRTRPGARSRVTPAHAKTPRLVGSCMASTCDVCVPRGQDELIDLTEIAYDVRPAHLGRNASWRCAARTLKRSTRTHCAYLEHARA